jgi:hypothetical protein
MKYRAICAGFDQDQSGDTSLADAGTLQHKAAETGDLSILTDEWHVKNVRKCLSFVESRIIKGLPVDAEFRELRLSILGGRTFGTVDRVIIRDTHSDIVDYKFGAGAIDDASENWQGICYVIGVFERFENLRTVTVWFLIPRRDEVTRHTFTRADLPDMRIKVATVISRAEQYRKTGDTQFLRRTEASCLYCANKATCPLMIEYALSTAHKYAPLEIVADVHASQLSDPLKLAKLYEAAKILEKMVDSAKKHIMDFALQNNGLHVGDTTLYEIAERDGKRSITNPGMAVEIFRRHLTDTEILSASTMSLSGVLKLISDKAPRGQKAKIVGAVESELESLRAVSPGEPIRYLKKPRCDTASTSSAEASQ